MSEEWGKVGLGQARVLGVDEQAPGLLKVSVPLRGNPSAAWLELFARGPTGPTWPSAMHPPRLEGSVVHLRPPDPDVEKYMNALRKRVDATNEQFEREILPEARRHREQAESEAAERERRMKDAQKRLDDLGPG